MKYTGHEADQVGMDTLNKNTTCNIGAFVQCVNIVEYADGYRFTRCFNKMANRLVLLEAIALPYLKSGLWLAIWSVRAKSDQEQRNVFQVAPFDCMVGNCRISSMIKLKSFKIKGSF